MKALKTKRIALSVLALGAASAAVVFGSFAGWTAQTTNPGNSVSTATLTMSNSRTSPSYAFSATAKKPGDTGGGPVTITNTGTSDMALKLTQVANPTVGTTELKLSVDDGVNCIYPVTTPAPCSSFGAWDASTSGNSGLNAISVGTLTASGGSKTFNINWDFPSGSATNASQGKTNSFDLVWDGTPI